MPHFLAAAAPARGKSESAIDCRVVHKRETNESRSVNVTDPNLLKLRARYAVNLILPKHISVAFKVSQIQGLVHGIRSFVLSPKDRTLFIAAHNGIWKISTNQTNTCVANATLFSRVGIRWSDGEPGLSLWWLHDMDYHAVALQDPQSGETGAEVLALGSNNTSLTRLLLVDDEVYQPDMTRVIRALPIDPIDSNGSSPNDLYVRNHSGFPTVDSMVIDSHTRILYASSGEAIFRANLTYSAGRLLPPLELWLGEQPNRPEEGIPSEPPQRESYEDNDDPRRVRFGSAVLGPSTISPDGKTIYVADRTAGAIRRIQTSTGAVHRIAGDTLGWKDGSALEALFSYPVSLAVTYDGCNLFVLDVESIDEGTARLRLITLNSSWGEAAKVTTVAEMAYNKFMFDSGGLVLAISPESDTLYVAMVTKILRLGINTSALPPCAGLSQRRDQPDSTMPRHSLPANVRAIVLTGAGVLLLVVAFCALFFIVMIRRWRRRVTDKRGTPRPEQSITAPSENVKSSGRMWTDTTTVSNEARSRMGSRMGSRKRGQSPLILRPTSGLKSYSLEEISRACENFSPELLVGKGGAAEVYKGVLGDGQVVAVKVMKDAEFLKSARFRQFQAELDVLGSLRHSQICGIVGYCAEQGKSFLLYPFVEGGTLYERLRPDRCATGEQVVVPTDGTSDGSVSARQKPPLDWKSRLSIARQVASALRYLHQQVDPPIVHRDVKSKNVLLEDHGEGDWTSIRAYLSDFGLAKVGKSVFGAQQAGETVETYHVAGTFGYMAPEYYSSCRLTVKNDVYAFGVLLLELITGRQAFMSQRQKQQQGKEDEEEQNVAREGKEGKEGEAKSAESMESEEEQELMESGPRTLAYWAQRKLRAIEVISSEDEEDDDEKPVRSSTAARETAMARTAGVKAGMQLDRIREIADQRLMALGAVDWSSVCGMTDLAMECIRTNPRRRPRMGVVMDRLIHLERSLGDDDAAITMLMMMLVMMLMMMMLMMEMTGRGKDDDYDEEDGVMVTRDNHATWSHGCCIREYLYSYNRPRNHTVEAMKTLVKKGSPAVDVYGLRAYSKVRVVYFGDDQTRGYFNVSAFDNMRENRAMMLSFEGAARDMRQWWIDNHRIKAPKGKVSDKDAVAVAHQKKWQNFLRASMGKACDKAFVKQALENECSKDWSNKLHGHMNLATSTEAVWPLVKKFFEMFHEGKLPVGDGKIPLDMPGRIEGRQLGPYTDETKGQRTLYHCIYARDGPKGSTVSWKDLSPSYFKNFEDLTCREREVALLLLMKGKVVATNVKVMLPRVNTECLLDIMRKECYMVRMFNYVVFRAEGRADDEWNDAFFMSYKDLEDRAVILDISPANFCTTWTSQEFDALHSMMTKCCGVNWVLFVFAPQKVQSDVLRCLFRWEDIELILGTWKRVDRPSNDITRYGNIATASRNMMAIVLHAEGGDLRKVTVAPHLLNDLTNVHVVEEKFGKCLGKHGGIEGDESVVYSIWEREPAKLRSLCGSFVGEAEGVFLLGRAHAGLVWKFLLAGNNVIACDESAKDIAYLTKFIDILVKDDRFNCHIEKPCCKHRPNRDMFHKLGPKRLKVWEYLFRDMPQGRLDGKYIYRKAKATETLKHYHAALTGAFETSVARCDILKFDLRKDQLMSKDYEELAKSGDGFNPVDSEEDSSDSDLDLGEDTCAEVPRGGMVQAYDDGNIHSHEGSIPVAAPSVASMVAPSETAASQDIGRCGDNEEDDIEIPGEASTLAPGDAIPPGYSVHPRWGVEDGSEIHKRLEDWLKTTELVILHRVRVENPGQSEATIKAKAEELFHVLRGNRQLEYSNKFYALRSSPSRGSINWKVGQTARTLEGSCSHDFMPSSEPASVPAQAGHRGDDGTTVVGPQEADMTSMPQISKKSISVAATQSYPPIDVSTTLPPDAGATYGSLLITNAAMEGRSEIESESDVGPSVAESQLQSSLCTSKGDAQSLLTPQGGAGGNGGKGGDVEGMHCSRNLDTLTADID
ncbi:hypothetical protein CBR_g8058 [Chara braunii]|uniref:Protein kinase domain-containing protein n=1 Tax=Chara braunii TaxID=69332 RepID=A0A388KL31_CHABU|nr:hypothetical protein CBR_g8058 [Chara braunii]|eukprot:GBG70760.1 hypothetical protein CBR_g8058 [Chara braunii]